MKKELANKALHRAAIPLRCIAAGELGRSGDAARHPNGPAAGARGSRRAARPEPAAAPDRRCTTCGCSAPAGEPRGR